MSFEKQQTTLVNDSGWIKIYRSLLEWEWFNDPVVLWVFIKCLLKANHKTIKWRGIIIEKGSFITSLTDIASNCISIQQARTALNKLKSTGEITIKSTNKYSIITICNWSKYQQINTQDNKQSTNNQQASNMHHKGLEHNDALNENGKNDKNEKKYIYNMGNTPENLKISLKSLPSNVGISKQWQDTAFRYASYLKIDLSDPKLKARWLKFFKENAGKKSVSLALSYLSDYPPFTSLKSAEHKVKYFFAYCYNNDKDTVGATVGGRVEIKS
jgi:hypothetical protein